MKNRTGYIKNNISTTLRLSPGKILVCYRKSILCEAHLKHAIIDTSSIITYLFRCLLDIILTIL